MSKRGPHIPFTRRRAQNRALAAWLGMVALAIQGLVPLGQAVPLGSSGANGPRTLVICSSYGGTRTITVPGAPGAPTGAERAACAVCMAYACGGGLDLPAIVSLPFPPAADGQHTGLPTHVAERRHVPGLPRPRGPPPAV